ncbi:MAG: M13 family metallopeptidase, partial [Acidobacteriota bacterium]
MVSRTRRYSTRWPLVLVALTAAALAPVAAQPPPRVLGIDAAAFDRTVRPQDDFNTFVNGTWMRTTEIPPDQSTWGSFVELGERSDAALREIIATATTSTTKSAAQRQVADLYASFMDTSRVEALGTEPLGGELKAIAAVTAPADLPSLFGRMARVGVGGPFGAFVGQDQKQSNTYIVSINQGGLGMPDRDYYLRHDAKSDATRAAYKTFISTLLTLAKQPDPAGAADRIIALETRIAQAHWERARNRDRDATYNKLTVAELSALTPSFAWPAFLKAAGLQKATSVVVRQPDYFKALDGIIRDTPIATWREMLAFKVLSTYSDELPEAFGVAQFEFRGKTLSGQAEMRTRPKRGGAEVEGALGEVLGRLYVDKYFAAEAKARMDQLVKNLLAAFGQGIDELEWMGPATKAQAHAKLAKFTVKIGYPDTWRDYSAIEVKRGDLLGNAKRSVAFEYDDMIGRLGRPVDRSRWSMTPQTVNAYYNSTNNEIVFPAAILQPPFFNVAADDAVNYGGIGAVIGHEISHGFD